MVMPFDTATLRRSGKGSNPGIQLTIPRKVAKPMGWKCDEEVLLFGYPDKDLIVLKRYRKVEDLKPPILE